MTHSSVTLILSPGKVGSSSVYNLLKNSLSHPVLHLHYLSQKGVKRACEQHLTSSRASLPAHLRISKIVSKDILNGRIGFNAVVMTREPLAREVSAVFQNLDQFAGAETKDLEVDMQKVREIIDFRLFQDYEGALDSWFRDEVQSCLGIKLEDVDISRGWSAHDSARGRVLFMRVEDLDRIGLDALSDLYGLKFDTGLFPRLNVGKTKYYAEAYKAINEGLLMHKKERELRESWYVKTFYPSS